MTFLEACQATRNYGCRIRRYEMNGIEMLSMENDLIKTVISVGKGADIVELVDKQSDTDLLWHSFTEQKNAFRLQSVNQSAGNFFDAYAGGWQELFPTYGDNTVYEGAEIGIHGEACIYPWTAEVLEDIPERIRVRFSLKTARTPFALEKELSLTLGSRALSMKQKVTNLSPVERDFMWGHHPAFGYPFLDENVKIRFHGTPKVTVPAATALPQSPFDQAAEGTWPVLMDRDGKPFDLSRAHAPEEKLYTEAYVSELEDGWYELFNTRKKIGIRMSWNKEVFPYVWIWGMYCGFDDYPWYGRAYTLGVEPWSTVPADYQVASARGLTMKLGPGASLASELCAEIVTEEED